MEFRDLDDSAPMSADQLKQVHRAHGQAPRDEPRQADESLRAWLDARTKDEEMVRAARRRLVEHGLPEERLLTVPGRPGDPARREARVRGSLRRPHEDHEPARLAGRGAGRPDQAGPRAGAVRRCPGAGRPVQGPSDARRLDQRIALLRHVEALRLYAAEHDGTLPAKLSEISVPLPDDPFTGKPFRYEVAGDTAHLRGSPPLGEEQEP